MPKKTLKVPVTLRAVIHRLNRKLAPQGEQLRATRGARSHLDLGEFYIIDLRRNCVISTNIDPEHYARELLVLKEWEEVSE